MTSTNVDHVKQSVSAFNRLNIDDRLAALALIYKEAASSLPVSALSTPSSEVAGLIKEIEKVSSERQVDALRDLLPSERNDQDEITLDPNPAKALTELVSGGNTVSTGSYGSLDAKSKLAFWYQVAQKLGSSVVAIPSDYSSSAKVTELLSSLKSLSDEQRIDFIKQVV